jgi:hypothetical protein
VITALFLAAAVAGQVKDEPAAKPAKPPVAAAQAEARPARKALATTKASMQAQSVLDARKARRHASNKHAAIRAAGEAAEYQRQLIAQEKAIREYQDYVVKMGPIWAAEHANQIQLQRNALIARQTDIMQQQTKNQEWLLWQNMQRR